MSNFGEEREGLVELKFICTVIGLEVRDRIVREKVRLASNGTINIHLDAVIDHIKYSEPHVLAARLWVDERLVARDFDCPQPLKYLIFSNRGVEVREINQNLSTHISEVRRQVAISTRKPVRCFVFEERDEITVSDSAIDIVPGDDQIVKIDGLKVSEILLSWRYIGQ